MMLSMTFNELNYGEIESQLSLVSRWLHDKLHFTYLIASILSLYVSYDKFLLFIIDS